MSESRRLVARTAAVASVAVLALVIVAPLVTSWRPSGVARAATPTDPVHGITVQGTGKITLTPDLASINVGVTFQGATAAKAVAGDKLDGRVVGVSRRMLTDLQSEPAWCRLLCGEPQ